MIYLSTGLFFSPIKIAVRFSLTLVLTLSCLNDFKAYPDSLNYLYDILLKINHFNQSSFLFYSYQNVNRSSMCLHVKHDTNEKKSTKTIITFKSNTQYLMLIIEL